MARPIAERKILQALLIATCALLAAAAPAARLDRGHRPLSQGAVRIWDARKNYAMKHYVNKIPVRGCIKVLGVNEGKGGLAQAQRREAERRRACPRFPPKAEMSPKMGTGTSSPPGLRSQSPFSTPVDFPQNLNTPPVRARGKQAGAERSLRALSAGQTEFTFVSPVDGTLEYVIFYLWDRGEETPKGFLTPMGVYRQTVEGESTSSTRGGR